MSYQFPYVDFLKKLGSVVGKTIEAPKQETPLCKFLVNYWEYIFWGNLPAYDLFSDEKIYSQELEELFSNPNEKNLDYPLRYEKGVQGLRSKYNVEIQTLYSIDRSWKDDMDGEEQWWGGKTIDIKVENGNAIAFIEAKIRKTNGKLGDFTSGGTQFLRQYLYLKDKYDNSRARYLLLLGFDEINGKSKEAVEKCREVFASDSSIVVAGLKWDDIFKVERIRPVS